MTPVTPETLGERIIEARKLRGLSRDQLAERAGIDTTLVAAYEAGQQTTFEAFWRLVVALDLPYQWFFAD